MAPAETPEQALELARKSPALKVRWQPVARWVAHLVRAGGASDRWAAAGLLPVQQDRQMLDVLRAREDGVPPEVLAGALHARDEAEAQAMLRAFGQGREGYAGTRTGRPEDPAVRPGAAPLAAWAAEGDRAPPAEAGPSGLRPPAPPPHWAPVRQPQAPRDTIAAVLARGGDMAEAQATVAALARDAQAALQVRRRLQQLELLEEERQRREERRAAAAARAALTGAEAAAAYARETAIFAAYGLGGDDEAAAAAAAAAAYAAPPPAPAADPHPPIPAAPPAPPPTAAAAPEPGPPGAAATPDPDPGQQPGREAAAAEAVDAAEVHLEMVTARMDGAGGYELADELATATATLRTARAELAAAVRAAQDAPAANGPRPASPPPDEHGPMHGLDGMDLQVEVTRIPDPVPDGAGAPADPHALALAGLDPQDVLAAMRPGDTAVRSRGEGLLPDYHRATFPACYPTTFPHGAGARPTEMSERAYFALVLARSPRKQHAAKPQLLCHMFNVQQRRSTNLQAKLQTHKYRGGDWDKVCELSAEQVTAVSTLFVQNNRNQDVRAALAAAPAAVRELYNAARRVDRKVVGSPGSMASLRSRNTSTWYAYGMWTAMLNLNPAELDEPVVFELAGRPYTFSSEGAPLLRPDAAERWRILAADPLAEAQFFDLWVHAFADAFLHFPVGAHVQQQRDPPCLFDLVAAWFLKPETSTRTSLHGHMCVSNPRLQPAALQRLAADPATCNAVFSLLERCGRQYLPSPFHSRDMPPKEGAGDPAHLVAAHRRGDEGERPSACRPSLPPREWLLARRRGDTTHAAELDQWLLRLRRQVALCVLGLQMHSHTHTCAKHGGEATDLDCRLWEPRPCVAATGMGPFGMVDVRRDHEFIVPFCTALMLACPMNQALFLAGETSRFNRLAAIYRWGASCHVPRASGCVAALYVRATTVSPY